ncbi:MAG: DUF998 domain-containing protein [Chloroflexi bacterium]|nr:DUF998 domain-containing protein [Chloroflexota bacterium]
MASRLPTRTLLLGGIAGPVLFVGAFLVEGATRPGYDPIRQYVSLLSLGGDGWAQVAAFIVSGCLIAAFGLGLARIWSRRRAGHWIARLVVVIGLALVWSGVFAPDPAQGYPPGMPQGAAPGALNGIPSNPTWHALLHFLGSVVVSTGLAAAGVLTAARGTRWRGLAARAWTVCSLATAAIVLGGWISELLTTGSSGPPATAGLLQRISIVAGMQWLVVTALIELRIVGFRRPAS